MAGDFRLADNSVLRAQLEMTRMFEKSEFRSAIGVTKNITSREATEPGRLEIPLTGVVDDSLRGLGRSVFRRKTIRG